MDVFWIATIVFSLVILAGPIICGLISEIPRSCKNKAFREYKAQTYQRILDEEQEFIKYLDEAAIAADRAAFEQFKASKK